MNSKTQKSNFIYPASFIVPKHELIVELISLRAKMIAVYFRAVTIPKYLDWTNSSWYVICLSTYVS